MDRDGRATDEPSAAVLAFKDWWYRAAPYPAEEARRTLEREVARGSQDPEVLYWRSRDILLSMYGRIDSERIHEVDRLARRAADAGLDIAIAVVAGEKLVASKEDDETRESYQEMLGATVKRGEREAVRISAALCRTGQGLEIAVNMGHVRAYRELALTRLETGEYADALAALRKGAVAGDAEARLTLGQWLRDGTASRRDVREAEAWFRRAAQAGHPVAQFELAMLLSAADQAASFPEALRLLEAAAERLDQAEFVLGRARLLGYLGSPVDPPAVEKIFRELAGRNHPGALFELGHAMLTGLWLLRDEAAAVEYLRRAEQAGSGEAAALLRLYRHQSESQ